MLARADKLDDPGSVVVMAATGTVPEWASEAAASLTTVVADPTTGNGALEETLESAAAVIVDGTLEAPLSLARRVRRLVPQLQIVVVAPPEKAEDLHRTMLFTPGLGEPWLVEPAELNSDLLRRAVKIGDQRRAHSRRLGAVSGKVARLEPGQKRRPLLPDQYLATLLELLPEPVLALDEDGRVLFANPAAESLLDIEEDERDERGALSLLAPRRPAELESLLERGREESVRAEMAIRPGGEPRTYDVSIAPVGGERPLRALILHDQTERHRREEERERLLEERNRALSELTEAMRHRRRFYTNMSHELRTPIHAIAGYNELLLDEVFGRLPDAQREVLDRIHRATEHLTELTEEILDLSRLEAGKLDLELTEVRIAELVEDLKASLEPLADSRSAELRFRVDASCHDPIRTDPRRVRQIVMNLISNAVHYGSGEPVDVRCACGDSGLRVEVEDRGPGIAPEEHEKIFEEFVQLGESAGAGTGLGLTIARSLARSLGGDVTVTSEPGVGSTFTATLPEV